MPPSNCRVFVRKFFVKDYDLEDNKLYLGHMAPSGRDFYIYDSRNVLRHLGCKDQYEVYPGVTQ